LGWCKWNMPNDISGSFPPLFPPQFAVRAFLNPVAVVLFFPLHWRAVPGFRGIILVEKRCSVDWSPTTLFVVLCFLARLASDAPCSDRSLVLWSPFPLRGFLGQLGAFFRCPPTALLFFSFHLFGKKGLYFFSYVFQGPSPLFGTAFFGWRCELELFEVFPPLLLLSYSRLTMKPALLVRSVFFFFPPPFFCKA